VSEVELDHVQIAAPPGCEPAARRFFGELLGLEEIAAELGDLAERLSAAGAPVTWDESLPGERRFYSEDPWGNRLEFLAQA
jgi:catechol 2,3-dioxygenase-like lactoylglutathione lyase family enzyme